MRRKGYLLLEIVIYLSLVSFLIIFVMNLSMFINRTYKEEVKNKIKETEIMDFDLHLDGVLKTRKNELEKIEISNSAINIYYEEGKKRFRELFSINGKVIYKRKYEYSLSGDITNTTEERSLIENINSFKVNEKEQLIYIEVEFMDGDKRNFVYEK